LAQRKTAASRDLSQRNIRSRGRRFLSPSLRIARAQPGAGAGSGPAAPQGRGESSPNAKGPPGRAALPATLRPRPPAGSLAGRLALENTLAGSGLLAPLLQNQLVAMQRDLADLVHRGTGAGRNKAADDDVLLETVERVHLAVDRGLGEHARRLLEGGGGEERARLQARLGDAEQQRVGAGRLAALLTRL